MRAERFIADRLRFKGKLAAVAVAVSFFVMIISLAIAGGFRREIRQSISGISGDVMLTTGEEPMSSHPACYERLEAVPGVAEVTPVIWKPGIVQGEGDICGVLVKGIPMPDSCSLQASIPARLAKRMKLEEGDAMTTWFVEGKAKARRFRISDIYEGVTDSGDAPVILVPLSDMQRVCEWTPEQAGALEVRLKPRFSEGAMLAAKADELSLASILGREDEDEDILRASTSRQRYPQLFDWLDLIDFNVLAILLLMTVVAGFNMISGLLILLFRNISTIGMLKSMGMGNNGIAKVFLRVSARLVLVGMAVGNAAALLFCLLQGTTHLIKLNPANYFVSYVPVHVNVPLILATDLFSFTAIMLLLLIPSLFIAKVDPARTVRVQ